MSLEVVWPPAAAPEPHSQRFASPASVRLQLPWGSCANLGMQQNFVSS